MKSRIKNRVIRTIALIPLLALVILTTCAGAHAQSTSPAGTSSLSCPPGYALSIDPPPPPTDDTGQPAVPMTAAEKQQAAEQDKASEMSRWHCVPMTTGTSAQ